MDNSVVVWDNSPVRLIGGRAACILFVFCGQGIVKSKGWAQVIGNKLVDLHTLALVQFLKTDNEIKRSIFVLLCKRDNLVNVKIILEPKNLFVRRSL